MIEMETSGARLRILPVVKGLKSEYPRVEEALRGYTGVVGVSLGAEELDAVRKADSEEWEYDPSDLEAVYAFHLKRFGDVSVPVPAFLAAAKLRDDLIPLDMDDSEFTEAYCDCVGVGDLLKEKKIAKKAMKHSFASEDAEGFAKEWDDYVNTIKGFRTLALRREECIAGSIDALLRAKGDVLAIIEAERVDGVLFELKMLRGA